MERVSIDCYVCTSINGSNKVCEDKFERNLDTFHMIERNCQYGYFKGTHCIKLKGTKEDGTHILVRHCSDANWGSHCGDIRYLDHSMEERIIGCLESCDFDGCNSAPPTRPSSLFLCLLSLALTFLLHLSL
ncbi:hypothetical protein C0Q70_01904 [Pomacea canaliculata]|uniref:Protein sleepless n=1 Tax=Pomacea canaliculata TaxID=400727 RepID=A0A2T7Q0S5_POMCA|nr:hypothetical protein C0Q70_01904 [Pomacea canaliculata]